jgi:hypothetical protein
MKRSSSPRTKIKVGSYVTAKTDPRHAARVEATFGHPTSYHVTLKWLGTGWKSYEVEPETLREIPREEALELA